jgi:hypothetical protein
MILQLRRLLPAAVAVSAALAVGVSGVAQGATPHAAHHKRHHHKKHRIPQHNGGDHDADNRGGPSDGDGNT